MTTFYAVTASGRKRIKGARTLEGATRAAVDAGLKLKRIDVVETARHVPAPPEQPKRVSLEEALVLAGWRPPE